MSCFVTSVQPSARCFGMDSRATLSACRRREWLPNLGSLLPCRSQANQPDEKANQPHEEANQNLTNRLTNLTKRLTNLTNRLTNLTNRLTKN